MAGGLSRRDVIAGAGASALAFSGGGFAAHRTVARGVVFEDDHGDGVAAHGRPRNCRGHGLERPRRGAHRGGRELEPGRSRPATASLSSSLRSGRPRCRQAASRGSPTCISRMAARGIWAPASRSSSRPERCPRRWTFRCGGKRSIGTSRRCWYPTRSRKMRPSSATCGTTSPPRCSACAQPSASTMAMWSPTTCPFTRAICRCSRRRASPGIIARAITTSTMLPADDSASRETWKKVFGARHYAFQHAGATFLVLDNVEYFGQASGRYRGSLGARPARVRAQRLETRSARAARRAVDAHPTALLPRSRQSRRQHRRRPGASGAAVRASPYRELRGSPACDRAPLSGRGGGLHGPAAPPPSRADRGLGKLVERTCGPSRHPVCRQCGRHPQRFPRAGRVGKPLCHALRAGRRQGSGPAAGPGRRAAHPPRGRAGRPAAQRPRPRGWA